MYGKAQLLLEMQSKEEDAGLQYTKGEMHSVAPSSRTNRCIGGTRHPSNAEREVTVIVFYDSESSLTSLLKCSRIVRVVEYHNSAVLCFCIKGLF